MIKMQVSVRNARLVRKGLQDLMADVPKIGRQDLYNVLVATRRRLVVEPAKFPEDREYPWISAKQRIAVILMIREGSLKVPYDRTRQYIRGYKIRRTNDGWILFNDVPWARWVAGTGAEQAGYQARVHAGRWLALDPTLREELQGIEVKILSHLMTQAEKRLGK